MLSTDDLDLLAGADSKCSREYVGTMAVDEFASRFATLARRNNRRGLAAMTIVNTDPSNEPGTHWLVVRKTRQKLVFFDPYGADPILYPDVYDALTEMGGVVTRSSQRLQDVDTTVCGHYCVTFCYAASRGESLRWFITYWMGVSDRYVRRIVERRLRALRNSMPRRRR